MEGFCQIFQVGIADSAGTDYADLNSVCHDLTPFILYTKLTPLYFFSWLIPNSAAFIMSSL